MYKNYDTPTFHSLEVSSNDSVPGVVFKVDLKGTLVMLKNKDVENPNVCVHVPAILGDGTHITAIGKRCVKGSFKRIVISDSIRTIHEEAFRSASVDEIIWPGSCTCVPDYCFFNCFAKKILNLRSVSNIGICAFSNMRNLEELDLSFSPVNFIGLGAFNGISNVNLPYYYDNNFC